VLIAQPPDQGDLEPGTDTELTPTRLAAFYKSCGVDYNELFCTGSSHGLSLVYKTLGCAHSLQPTPDPYETPSIPCLKALGYLRWQTIQLQLDPAVHVPVLQKAVELYDVPKPDGGTFPKHIPTEAFPAQPDKEIEDWWRRVTNQLTQEDHMRRLGSSPFRSPLENGDRTEYVTQNGRLSASQRPHRASRHNSEDRMADARRRSSVPELIFNQNGDIRPESREHTSRSHSAQRTPSGPYNYPPPPHAAGPQRHPTSVHRNSAASLPYRPSANGIKDPNGLRRHRSSGGHNLPRRRNRSPSTIDESSGSEASSEDSRSGRDRKSYEERRRSSLWPPSNLLHHNRRHSHDATYDKLERPPPLPPRPAPIQTHVRRPSYNQASPQSASRRRGFSNLNNIPFRNDIFQDQHVNSAPETPVAPEYVPSQPVPRMRYESPPQNMRLLQGPALSRTTSGENGHNDQNHNFGPPTRSKTVTMGVGGRRYPVGEPRGGGPTTQRRDRTLIATPVGLSQSG
jgi:hypothetical protein